MTNNRRKMLNSVKFLILSLFISMVVSQNLESFMQKTTLENSLRDKIYSEVGHVIDKTKFVVVVNLDLDNGSLTPDLKSTQLKNPSNQLSDLEAKSPTAENSMDFIPGFQLSDSNTQSESSAPQKPSFANTLPGKNNWYGSFGSLKINKINVNFFLEESLASPVLDKTIITLVNGIIPLISDCDDCISIQTMQFQQSSEISELESLREKIETMEKKNREEELAKLDQKFEDLQNKLSRSEDQREMWEEQAILDREFQRRQDSLRLVKLEANEYTERLQLDTLLFKAQQKIDTVINARINSETETKKDLIDIIKYGQGNLSEGENQGILGMKGSSSDSTLIYLGSGIIILLVFIILLFKRNKQEVVYLKPKGGAKKKIKKDKQKNKVEEKEVAKELEEKPTEEIMETEVSTNPFATMAFEDENVIRAELKALRQSAVSMSVNQREGATQIVKDWLSDGASDSKTDGEEG